MVRLRVTALRILPILLAASGTTRRWLIGMFIAWLLTAAAAAVTLPLKYPYDVQSRLIDSGVLVGLVLPVTVASQILREGSGGLIAGASRSLTPSRLSRAGAFFLLTSVGAVLTPALAPVPRSLIVLDAQLLAALAVAGTGLVGARLSWLLPAGLVTLASSPHVVPWQANLVYRTDSIDRLIVVTSVVTVLSVLIYARQGAYGCLLNREVRAADTDTMD